MNIKVISSVGVGETKLSAFDNALSKAGVNNYNLIVLSSVIPLHATVIKQEMFGVRVGDIGDRLYVVKADMRSNKHNRVISAALGWYSFESGGGVFVEHEAAGTDTNIVVSDIKQKIEKSIRDLCMFRNERYEHKKLNMSISIAKVDVKPTCVLTIAVYKAEPWE